MLSFVIVNGFTDDIIISVNDNGNVITLDNSSDEILVPANLTISRATVMRSVIVSPGDSGSVDVQITLTNYMWLVGGSLVRVNLDRPSSSSSTDAGAIAGSVLGVVFFLCLLCVGCGIVFIYVKQKEEDSTPRRETLSQYLGLQKQHQSNLAIDLLTDVKIQNQIGSGHFGKVYVAEWQNVLIALKSATSEIFEFVQEVQLLRSLEHPNVIRCFGLYQNEESWFLCSEFMQNGDLLSYIHKHTPVGYDELMVYCYQTCVGMAYLHSKSKNIIHRDLSARNLLLSGDNVIKIADFGLSRVAENYYYSESKKIPVRWTAPEALTFHRFTKASDIWSFGVVMWECYSQGAVPYSTLNNFEVAEFVQEGNRMKPPKGTPRLIKDMMIKCWNHSPDDRPSFTELEEQFPRNLKHRSLLNSHTSTPPEANATDLDLNLQTTRKSESNINSNNYQC